MQTESNSNDVSSMKSLVFTVAVVAAMAMGIYSLTLASMNAGHPTTTEGMLRTAMPTDSIKIELALGDLVESDLVFVVVDTSERDPAAAIAARSAAETLNVSGLDVSVRHLDPDSLNFATIVEQNEIDRFPAVLAVKKNGGIVRLTDEVSDEALVHIYRSVWGTSSSCDAANSDIY